MTKFLLKTFFVLTVLLFGIVFGIHQANQGTLSLFGKHGGQQTMASPPAPTEKKAERQKEVKAEQPASAPEKKEVQKKQENKTKDLEEKQQLAADVGAFNFYSELGSNIGEILELIVHHTVSAITSIIHGWLNK